MPGQAVQSGKAIGNIVGLGDLLRKLVKVFARAHIIAGIDKDTTKS